MRLRMPFLIKSGLIFLFIVVTNTQIIAQRFDSQLNEAIRVFDSKNYVSAIEKFNLLLKYGKATLSEKEKLSILLKLAFSYKENNESLNAENVYREILNTSSNLSGEAAKAYLHFSQVLASNGKLQEAQKYFALYEESQSTDSKLQESTKKGDVNAKKTQDPFSNFYPYKVEFLAFNSARSDFSPAYYKDGIVFCANDFPSGKSANGKVSKYWDLYYMSDISKVQKVAETEIEKIKKNALNKNAKSAYDYRRTSNDSQTLNYNISEDQVINTIDQAEQLSKVFGAKYHWGPATFSRDFTKIIFSSDYVKDGAKSAAKDEVGGKYKLYISENINGRWTEAVELPFNGNNFSTSQPSWTADERLLFFASDRNGGFGGMDIWVVEYQKGHWGEPKNLGKDVNSKDSEEYPFVDAKGNLYYASNGQGTKGGYDIFFVEMNGTKNTSLPLHLSEPFNTIYDDFGIVADASRRVGYFSSNRHSNSDFDIYRFMRESKPNDCYEKTLSVFDANTKNGLASADVTIVAKGGKPELKKTDSNGKISFCTTQDTDYTIKINKAGYQTNSLVFSASSESALASSELEVLLDNVKKNELELKIAPSRKEMTKILSNSKVSSKTGKRSITGYVVDANNQPVEGVNVIFKNICDNTVQQVISGPDGGYTFLVNADCNSFTVEKSKSGFAKTINHITPQGTMEQGEGDKLYKEGDKIILYSISYENGTSTLRPEAIKELNRLANILSKTPSMVIELGSHTDSRGDDGENLRLSLRRAQVAKDYLIGKGISGDRIYPKGYGEKEPINGCTNGVSCTESEHQKNRRTTIKILKVR